MSCSDVKEAETAHSISQLPFLLHLLYSFMFLRNFSPSPALEKSTQNVLFNPSYSILPRKSSYCK
jgi:hypothetical protein